MPEQDAEDKQGGVTHTSIAGGFARPGHFHNQAAQDGGMVQVRVAVGRSRLPSGITAARFRSASGTYFALPADTTIGTMSSLYW